MRDSGNQSLFFLELSGTLEHSRRNLGWGGGNIKMVYYIGEWFEKGLGNSQINLLPHNRALYLYKYSQENLPN